MELSASAQVVACVRSSESSLVIETRRLKHNKGRWGQGSCCYVFSDYFYFINEKGSNIITDSEHEPEGFPRWLSGKEPAPPMQETQAWSLGQEDPLEEEMAANSSLLAWRTPWTEEPGGLQSMGSQRVGHDLATKLTHIWVRKFGDLRRESKIYANSQLVEGLANPSPLAHLFLYGLWVKNGFYIFSK